VVEPVGGVALVVDVVAAAELEVVFGTTGRG
jgi:hypothetical protein